MRSKTDFYRLFFEQLARKGFDVKRSQSSDYIADIYYKNQLVAYFSKADTVIQNPFVAVKDKVMRLISDTAQNTAVKVGICRDCPYESDLDTITPEIKTPRAVGQYQHGSARWMSDAEKEKAFDSFILDPNDPVMRELLKTGYDGLDFMKK